MKDSYVVSLAIFPIFDLENSKDLTKFNNLISNLVLFIVSHNMNTTKIVQKVRGLRIIPMIRYVLRKGILPQIQYNCEAFRTWLVDS